MNDAKRIKLRFSEKIMTNLEGLASRTQTEDVTQLFAESLGAFADASEDVEILELVDYGVDGNVHEFTLDINPMVAQAIDLRAQNEGITRTEVIRLSVGQFAVQSGDISFN